MKRPDMLVLQDLIDDMYSMDSEEMMKKRRNMGGQTITISIGESKPTEEGEMETEDEKPMGDGLGVPVSSPMSEMEDDEDDMEEKTMCEEARSLGIPDPESMDMRLLKKLIEKKKMV